MTSLGYLMLGTDPDPSLLLLLLLLLFLPMCIQFAQDKKMSAYGNTTSLRYIMRLNREHTSRSKYVAAGDSTSPSVSYRERNKIL